MFDQRSNTGSEVKSQSLAGYKRGQEGVCEAIRFSDITN